MGRKVLAFVVGILISDPALPTVSGPDLPLPALAVMDFDPGGGPLGDALLMAELVRVAALRRGRWSVIERGAMARIMSEQAFQSTGCTGADCAIKLGRLLSAQNVIAGACSREGGARLVSIRLLDIATGSEVGVATERGFSVAGAEDAADRLIANLDLVTPKPREVGRRPGPFMGVMRLHVNFQGSWRTMLESIKGDWLRLDDADEHAAYAVGDCARGVWMTANLADKLWLESPMPGLADRVTKPIRPQVEGAGGVVSGQLCERWTARFSGGVATLWVTRDLGPICGWNGWGIVASRIIIPPDSFLMKCEITDSSGRNTEGVEVVSISATSLSDSLFHPPPGMRIRRFASASATVVLP